MRLSVIGAGYLGAVHATALASVGFNVVAVDTDAAKVAVLNTGMPPFHEPGFGTLLADNLGSGRLTFTTDISLIDDCDVHFLCVGTPQSASGSGADLQQVWAAVRSMAGHLKPGSVVAGKSTVPVGTAAAIAEHLAGLDCDATVVWNPEFLREGFAVRDTLEPDRIVVGAPDGPQGEKAVAALRRVYAAPLSVGTPFLVTDLATAELVKVAANAFLATKISFINAMAEICEETGADVTELATAIGHDSRIGAQFLKAGIGFGGGCLPKDIRAFRGPGRGTRAGADVLVPGRGRPAQPPFPRPSGRGGRPLPRRAGRRKHRHRAGRGFQTGLRRHPGLTRTGHRGASCTRPAPTSGSTTPRPCPTRLAVTRSSTIARSVGSAARHGPR